MKITIPKSEALSGGSLNDIVQDLNIVSNPVKGKSNGDVVYEEANQELFEDILTHTNVMDIASKGGNIEGYIMYAKIPYAIEVEGVMTSIYEVIVPEGLRNRTMRATDGTQIIEGISKNLKLWADSNLEQKFSEDFQFIYVLTNPLRDYLTAQELKLFVDGYQATLLTRKEYSQITTI